MFFGFVFLRFSLFLSLLRGFFSFLPLVLVWIFHWFCYLVGVVSPQLYMYERDWPHIRGKGMGNIREQRENEGNLFLGENSHKKTHLPLRFRKSSKR